LTCEPLANTFKIISKNFITYQKIIISKNLVGLFSFLSFFIFYLSRDAYVNTFVLHGAFCFSQAVTAMVQQAMQYIDETPDLETRIELIKTLNSVSAGKVNIC
jgi:hypothetical protein